MDYGFTKIDVERKQQNISSTLPFIAPEIYLRKNPVPQSDFYSLGVILYKITTGILPYSTEQISGFIAGNNFNLLPKFPRELNEDIPPELETLILQLLEKNPEDRFSDIESIITFINKFQVTDYPFSHSHSIVNNIKFSDYIVRDDYAHQLLDYVPIIENGNGKIIVLKAGKGLGKTNAISLFRYHILYDKYYRFDYQCGPQSKDPFFALIKEFYFAAELNNKFADPFNKISDKMREYLFESEDAAFKIEQGKKDLDLDYISASKFIFQLSQEKPLIFTIRAGEYLSKEVIKFINFISHEVTKLPILIILCINDPRKIEGLIHPVEISIEPLSMKKTEEYISKLLSVKPPQEFVEKLWQRSNGNPMFLENILIDLTQRRLIWDEDKFFFDIDIDNYQLPFELRFFIEEKIEQLLPTSVEKLQKLAAVLTPLTKELIENILDINDKEIFFFIKDCINNEILRETEAGFVFTFKEVKEYFIKKINTVMEEMVSSSVIKYFHDKRIHSIVTLHGIIEHAEKINDLFSIKRFNYQLLNLLIEEHYFEEAFDVIRRIVEMNFQYSDQIEPQDKIRDLIKLIELSEWAMYDTLSGKLKDSIINMKETSEKNLLIGLFHLAHNKYSLAKTHLEKANAICITGKLKIFILLKLGELYLIIKNHDAVKTIISEIEKYSQNEDLLISLIILKASYMLEMNYIDDGITLIEEFIPTINTGNDAMYFVKLGRIHNILAILYREKRNYEETTKNYQITRKIWEKVKYSKKLGTIYNNLGDVALIKGDTNTALEFFEQAMKISKQHNSTVLILLTNLNFGETYIKLGDFVKAEEYLLKAHSMSENMENKLFYDDIIYNLGIAKSKIYNLNYYYSFIKKNAPEMISGDIDAITPLVKSYFYYLFAIGDYEKIEHRINRYKSLFAKNKENEFFNQISGHLLMIKNEPQKAKEKIDKSYEFSKKTQSIYAQMISYIRLTECYLNIGEIDKAQEYSSKAQTLCKKYNFFYWEQVSDMLRLKTELLDSNKSLRKIIRDLLSVMEIVQEHNFFLLEIEINEILIQIYSYLKEKKMANSYFCEYKKKIEEVSQNIPKHDRAKFFHKTKYYLNDPFDLISIKIASRSKRILAWQEELYSVVKLKEVKRIRFFIDKVIKNLFTPYRYAIILFDELKVRAKPFLSYNIKEDVLYSDKFRKRIQNCMDAGKSKKDKIDGNHIIFVPLKIRSTIVGVMVISDNGELDFQRYEMNAITTLRLHLTAILLRINDFAELNADMELMRKFVIMTQAFFSIMNTDKLNQEVTAFTMDFIGASRGFLISKDENENYVYDVAMDNSKHMLKNYTYISKDVISEVQKQQRPILIKDVSKDSFFDRFIAADIAQISVYCSPIIVDHEIVAFMYFDNLNNTDVEIQINQEFMDLLNNQISVAYRNAKQYEALNQKNKEIKSLDELKNEFINIVSHELKTPLVTLQGYINRLAKSNLKENEEDVFKTMQSSVNNLFNRTNDIVNFSRYNQINRVETILTDIDDILKIVAEELREISVSRNMHFKIEIEDNLPSIRINWEAFHLLITNIGLNAIRFTKDFGTITIGARHSAFQKEEINNKESIVIYIQDNGMGIPKGELTNVFQKFYELNKLYAHKSGNIEYRSSGLGLGLATAKLITELHKGKIWINSKEDQGTTVFIAIPL